MSKVTKEERAAFKALVKLEPRLGALLKTVRAIKDDGGECFCANGHWYGYGRALRDGAVNDRGLKGHLVEIVGWGRGAHEDEGAAYSGGRGWGYFRTAAEVEDAVARTSPGAVLRSSDAYGLAYHVIYEALPNCRDCGCAGMG